MYCRRDDRVDRETVKKKGDPAWGETWRQRLCSSDPHTGVFEGLRTDSPYWDYNRLQTNDKIFGSVIFTRFVVLNFWMQQTQTAPYSCHVLSSLWSEEVEKHLLTCVADTPGWPKAFIMTSYSHIKCGPSFYLGVKLLYCCNMGLSS